MQTLLKASDECKNWTYITTDDSENFIVELKKMYEVMHVVDAERVELGAYQLKGVAKTWFDQ